jgi:hypothetical protein
MRTIGIALLVNMSSVAAIVCAAVTALHGVVGWGWFLLIAVMLTRGWSSKDGEVSDA